MNAESTGLGEHPALSEFLGNTDRKPQQADREDRAGGIPIAPAQHPEYGMTVEQLAESQRRFTNYARLRLQGTGSREYSYGNKQAFEDMDPHRLINEMRDELADAVNYLTFLDIKLARWKHEIEERA